VTTVDFDTKNETGPYFGRCTLGFRCGCARCFATIEVTGPGGGLCHSLVRSQSSKRRLNTCNGKTKPNPLFFRDLAGEATSWI